MKYILYVEYIKYINILNIEYIKYILYKPLYIYEPYIYIYKGHFPLVNVHLFSVLPTT